MEGFEACMKREAGPDDCTKKKETAKALVVSSITQS